MGEFAFPTISKILGRTRGDFRFRRYLGVLRLLYQITIDWVPYKQQKFLSLEAAESKIKLLGRFGV